MNKSRVTKANELYAAFAELKCAASDSKMATEAYHDWSMASEVLSNVELHEHWRWVNAYDGGKIAKGEYRVW